MLIYQETAYQTGEKIHNTVAKSPQCYKVGEKEGSEKGRTEGRKQPISTACHFALSQLAPSLTSHSSFNNTYTRTPTLRWHLSALWIDPSWKVKSQRSMRLIKKKKKKNVGFSASENERHHKKSKGQWSLLFLIFLSWLIISSDKIFIFIYIYVYLYNIYVFMSLKGSDDGHLNIKKSRGCHLAPLLVTINILKPVWCHITQTKLVVVGHFKALIS